MHAARHGEVGEQFAVEYCDPAQGQAKLVRLAEGEARRDFEVVNVNVGLVEAVEEHERVRAFVHEPPRNVSDRTEVRAELHRHGDRDRALHVAQYLDVAALDRLALHVRVGRDEIDVKLQGVRARLLNQSRVLDPTARRRAVEAADDGNIHRHLRVVNQAQVLVGADVVVAHFGEVALRLGVAVRAVREAVVNVEALEVNLLLEERVHYDRAHARVLQTAYLVERVRQRRGRGHDRVLQTQAHVTGAQVHS